MNNKEPQLVRPQQCYEILFPNREICIRSFNEWKNRGYFPQIRIGRTILLNPVEVRKALEQRFTIPAAPVK